MSSQTFDIAEFLDNRHAQILDSAEAALSHSRLPHYDASEPGTRARLQALLHVVVDSCRQHRLEPALAYAGELAGRRHSGGVPLAEVQTTINVLEESVWRTITAEAAPTDQTYGLGMVATVLGAVKDRVACGYLDQITNQPVKSLRVDLLFAGTEAPLDQE